MNLKVRYMNYSELSDEVRLSYKEGITYAEGERWYTPAPATKGGWTIMVMEYDLDHYRRLCLQMLRAACRCEQAYMSPPGPLGPDLGIRLVRRLR
jgi:hypothetical protein